MDTTPVLQRRRSKLSRSRTSPGSASTSTPVTPGGEGRRAGDVFSTPHRPTATDASYWDSPASAFSPPPLSQACEIYWDDELPRRRPAEAVQPGPGDRVPPLPATFTVSAAPIVPINRRRPLRGTRQQQLRVMELLDTALCYQQQLQKVDSNQAGPKSTGLNDDAQGCMGQKLDILAAAIPVLPFSTDTADEHPHSVRKSPRLSAARACPTQVVKNPKTENCDNLSRKVATNDSFGIDTMSDDDLFDALPDEAVRSSPFFANPGIEESKQNSARSGNRRMGNADKPSGTLLHVCATENKDADSLKEVGKTSFTFDPSQLIGSRLESKHTYTGEASNTNSAPNHTGSFKFRHFKDGSSGSVANRPPVMTSTHAEKTESNSSQCAGLAPAQLQRDESGLSRPQPKILETQPVQRNGASALKIKRQDLASLQACKNESGPTLIRSNESSLPRIQKNGSSLSRLDENGPMQPQLQRNQSGPPQLHRGRFCPSQQVRAGLSQLQSAEFDQSQTLQAEINKRRAEALRRRSLARKAAQSSTSTPCAATHTGTQAATAVQLQPLTSIVQSQAPKTGSTSTVGTAGVASQQQMPMPVPPAIDQAEINRRRAQALRRLRQNQRARQASASNFACSQSVALGPHVQR